MHNPIQPLKSKIDQNDNTGFLNKFKTKIELGANAL